MVLRQLSPSREPTLFIPGSLLCHSHSVIDWPDRKMDKRQKILTMPTNQVADPTPLLGASATAALSTGSSYSLGSVSSEKAGVSSGTISAHHLHAGTHCLREAAVVNVEGSANGRPETGRLLKRWRLR